MSDTAPSTFFWGLSTTLQILGVASNAPILVVILSRGLLTSPNTRLVFSLCLSHLLLCLLLLISSWVEWGCGPVLVGLVVQLASLATLTLISLDRYISIARPMECSRILTPNRALMALGVAWGGAGLVVVPAGVLLNYLGVWWRIYFALLLGGGTLTALVLMTLAYSHIFKIARQKCAKVRLGEFRCAPGSISSEWGTSVGAGGGQTPALLASPPSLARGFSSQALLQKLGQGRTLSASSTASSIVPSSTSRSGSGSSGTSSTTQTPPPPPRGDTSLAGMAAARRRWRAYLRHNYNSPKKTVVTILALIGSVVLCSLPPVLSLLLSPALFPWVTNGLLLPLSSNLHPLLYGLLNRAIRHHLVHGSKRAALLPKSLRRKRGQRRKVSTLGELRSIFVPPGGRRRKRKVNKGKGEESRRGSTTEEELGGVGGRPRADTGQLKAWRPRPREEEVVVLVEDEEVEEEVGGPPEGGGRRRSSQDSGADMNFSETEEEEERGGANIPSLVLTGSRSESNLGGGGGGRRKYSHTHQCQNYLSPGLKLLSPLSLSADAHLHILVGAAVLPTRERV